ncbi:cytochrome c3 family protein [Rhodoferax sp.]|uniref:cytochrome c3 family protein n=1 Tax=Rhodoferax sp. TaxID=50421 RepID=UPI002630B5AC|nr:cytochrome c3 family protein [Rhodoferax sp.]MDD2918866.1 cytochrome c3 family protein [Rhodoferax sp.]
MNAKFDWNRLRAGLLGLLLAGVAGLYPVQVMSGIANTRHNLTPSGPGTVKVPETEPAGTCVFCHTPHNASPARSLWNRTLSAATYTLYTSSTLKAVPTQPTGSSRLCLSCHDGTLAMGTLLRSPGGVQFTLDKLTGAGVLGTDLSNDHPISFTYNSQLATDRGELVDPIGAPSTLHLDVSGQVQCTSCHDAHVERAKFMRFDPVKGALCTTCHRPTGWPSVTPNPLQGHASSTAEFRGTETDTNPWPSGGYTTVEDNACLNCHRSHAAGHGKGLLAQTGEAANCTVCHSGLVANTNFNLSAEFTKTSRHTIDIDPWTHEPKEDASLMPRHVSCADCHNPHAADASTATVPNVTGPLKGVRGINQAGSPVAAATFQQEVCYKCHGLSQATTTSITRQDNERNVRLEFDPANASYHPVAAAGKNLTIPNNSFVAGSGLTYLSRIGCGSCHNNDGWTAGGTNPAGPHGSNYAPLLERNYNSASTVIESATEFAMCYKCHDQNDLLTTTVPGKFPHAKHLSTSVSPTSCATCHDAHGSRTQTRLINFVTFDVGGIAVVTQSGGNPITFNPAAKSCTLMCHGNDHNPKTY